jgi:glycosyltransferase involved in cell wall biosynthesis
MPHKANIAAIIPVYNRPNLVLDAMMSVVRQTLVPRRLIVVDDGSTDDTAQRVQQWFDDMQLPFACQLIRQSNQGPAAARNRAVQVAGDCDLLAFLDSDDLWPDDYLQRMSDTFAANPQAVAASADREDRDYAHHRSDRHDVKWVTEHTTSNILLHGSPGTPNTVIRRAAFEQVRGFDVTERCGEDYHLILRLSLLGAWCYVPGDPVGVRRGLQSDSDQAPNLSKLYPDRRLRLARILDHFIHEDGGCKHVPEKIWKKRIGRLWFSAGRIAYHEGNFDLAQNCLSKAQAYMPAHLRVKWLRWKIRHQSSGK